MVKVFALIPRRPDVTEEFFHAHWAGPHAELAKRITTIRRYVQSHRVAAGLTGLPDAIYEGVAEVWFDDVATAAGMGEDPNYAEGAHVDEPTFIDVERLGFLLSGEEVLRDGPPVGRDDPGAKAMLLLARAGGLAPEAFARGVRGIDVAAGFPDARRVSVAVAIPESYADGAAPPFDAVVELWFADAESCAAAWRAGGAALLAALGAVADADRSAALVAEELRVIWPDPVSAGA